MISKDFLAVAKEAASAAGRIQMESLGRVREIEYKTGEINLVTEVDRACEEAIVRIIHGAFPDHEIIAEEGLGRKSESDYHWFVDPLDGTTNYAHSYPRFCASIGLAKGEEVLAGVIYDPVMNEMFEAQHGKGALLNGRPIRVTGETKLHRSLLATGFAYDVRESKINNLDHFTNFIMTSRAVRRDGSAALNLVYLACGRFDGFWELKLNPWDIAAGKLIVEEAGGKVTDFKGAPVDLYSDEILASNGRIHEQMMEVLAAE